MGSKSSGLGVFFEKLRAGSGFKKLRAGSMFEKLRAGGGFPGEPVAAVCALFLLFPALSFAQLLPRLLLQRLRPCSVALLQP